MLDTFETASRPPGCDAVRLRGPVDSHEHDVRRIGDVVVNNGFDIIVPVVSVLVNEDELGDRVNLQ